MRDELRYSKPSKSGYEPDGPGMNQRMGSQKMEPYRRSRDWRWNLVAFELAGEIALQRVVAEGVTDE